jgi:outer membrane protein OmpA-like peptidoglycan-associated protein
MASSITDSILALITPEAAQALAARLGESPQSLQAGFATSTAAALDGLATKVEYGDFRAQVLNLLSDATAQNGQNPSSIVADGPTGTTAEMGDRFLPMVFGSQEGQVARAIAEQHGLSASSAMALLRLAAPLLLEFFGRIHSAGALDSTSLTNMLRAEAPNLRNYLPAGLLGSAAGVTRADVSRAPAVLRARSDAQPVAPPRWLVPVAIASAVLLTWLVIRAITAPAEKAPMVATVTAEATNAPGTLRNAATEAATAAWSALGDMMKVKLPDGSELTVPSLGVEARLVQFLNDTSLPVGETTWFDFDRLLFDAGKATLQAASQEQLANIAAILKAYPQIRVRIGGYTDNTGDAAINLRLSEERADNVMDELVRLGIDPDRMSARGYGDENPVADNGTEEGRQKNRRISLRVTNERVSV